MAFLATFCVPNDFQWKTFSQLTSVLSFSLLLILSMITQALADDWKLILKEELPKLGHRNYIAVVDSAYPWQTAPGVETVVTGEDQLVVCKYVLDLLKDTKHVQPVIFIDKELALVSEAHAPGVSAYRTGLDELLKGKNPNSLLHEQIIANLDEAGKTFHVLVLKTNLTIPYTSVFLRLDCGYWTPEAEAELRSAMK